MREDEAAGEDKFIQGGAWIFHSPQVQQGNVA